jgi:hypothetical protein
VSLYREAESGRRRLWLGAGAALLVVAVIAGVALTRGGEPSPEEQLASLQDDVQPALAALELIPLHYESTNATTHAAAASQLAVARETVAGVESDLRELDPTATEQLVEELDALDELVRTTGRADEVDRASREAVADLRRLARLD